MQNKSRINHAELNQVRVGQTLEPPLSERRAIQMPSTSRHEKKLQSRKFWLTVYSVVLFPGLLWMGWIDGSHFVALYPMTLGLYFGGNVWQKRTEMNYQGSSYDYSEDEPGRDYWNTRVRNNRGDLQVSERQSGVSPAASGED